MYICIYMYISDHSAMEATLRNAALIYVNLFRVRAVVKLNLCIRHHFCYITDVRFLHRKSGSFVKFRPFCPEI